MMCACGATNSCSNGKKCNCYNRRIDSGWKEDSGLLTDKSVLPVTQIRLGDLNDSNEEGYHTLGKLKCYGVAWDHILIFTIQQLTTVQQVWLNFEKYQFFRILAALVLNKDLSYQEI